MKVIRALLSTFFSIVILVSCADSEVRPREDSVAGPDPIQSKNRPNASLITQFLKLIFAGIDPLSSPWQARVMELDLTTGFVEPLLSGESGDPALFLAEDEVIFFNRSFDSQNFRRLSLSGDKLQVSSQLKFPGGVVGDPHDAVSIGPNKILLAHYNEGSLVVMEQSSGKILEKLSIDWNLPLGITLKPEALLMLEYDNRKLIYVIHQALGNEEGLLFANGSQTVFVLELKDGTIGPLDLDPDLPRVQGIKIKGSFPMPVRNLQNGKILLASMCSRLITALDQDPSKQCINSIEEIDPSTQEATVLWDLQGQGLFMNGPITPGPEAHIFFANVVKQIGTRSFEKQLVKIDVNRREINTAYKFNPDSGGFWGTFYDALRGKLYVGDLGTRTVGKFVIISDDGSMSEIQLDQIPYTGVFASRGK